MSRLADLLASLPGDVEQMALGDVGEFIRGRRITKDDFVESGVGCIHYGEIYTRYGTTTTETYSFVRPELAERLRLARTGDLIIAATGENAEDVCKAVAWLGNDQIAIHDDCYVYRHGFDPTYIAYVFQSSLFRKQKIRFAAGAKMVRVSGEKLARIRVPVPPLEVQREIAEILARFEALETELTAALRTEQQSRRCQYAHYRDHLLAIKPREREWWPTLSDVAEIRAGWGFPPRYQGVPDGPLPFYKVSDMNTSGNEVVMGRANNYIDERIARELGAVPAPAGTVIFPKIGAAIATNKKRVLAQRSCYDNNIFGVIPSEQLDSRYLLHHLQSVDLVRFAHDGGAVPSIRKSDLASHRLHVPPIDEQCRLASALDRLEAHISYVIRQLAEEAAARSRQFASYRDRLVELSPG